MNVIGRGICEGQLSLGDDEDEDGDGEFEYDGDGEFEYVRWWDGRDLNRPLSEDICLALCVLEFPDLIFETKGEDDDTTPGGDCCLLDVYEVETGDSAVDLYHDREYGEGAPAVAVAAAALYFAHEAVVKAETAAHIIAEFAAAAHRQVTARNAP